MLETLITFNVQVGLLFALVWYVSTAPVTGALLYVVVAVVYVGLIYPHFDLVIKIADRTGNFPDDKKKLLITHKFAACVFLSLLWPYTFLLFILKCLGLR